MTTRQILITAVTSLCSAVAAIFLYQKFVPQQQVIIRDTTEARYASQQDLLNEIRPRTFLSSSPTSFSAAAEAVTPGVVFIRAYQATNGNFLRRNRPEVTTSTGSGVIINKSGYIITNNHVIEGGQRFEVILSDKREYLAELIGSDPSTDLALLKIDDNNLPNVEFGNSDSLRIGEWVLAVGNPFNLESTVTAGIVSAKGRNIDILDGQDRIESFIQTDAVVNPGNSGGALVNTNGELVGINTAIITRSGGYEGYSFAVPVNLVRKIVKDLQIYGQVQRGLLGAYITDVTASIAEDKQLDEVAGVLITRIAEGGGADNADLEVGDVITGINGKSVKTVPALQEILGQLRPGDRVSLNYTRNGTDREVKIVLKNKNNGTSTLALDEEQLLHGLGFELRNLSREERKRLDAAGVKVMSIFRGSEIESTNMEPGFIITSINDSKVRDLDDALRLLKRGEGQTVLRGIYENYEGEYFYAFNLP
ncbi:MAG: trypsin-like peptidase domain-containing protein [Bacteroidota bacterium]